MLKKLTGWLVKSKSPDPGQDKPREIKYSPKLKKRLKNSIINVNPDLCAGCGACSNSCPKKAISMVLNIDGFYAPLIDPDLCVNCGMCQNSCPIDNLARDKNPEPSCYALYIKNKHLLKESSSGGFFSILADFVRAKQGYVAGAAFNDNMELVLKLFGPDESVDPLKGSKYLQARPDRIYKDIRILLRKGHWVLFTGTPCQTAGLNRFLGEDYEKLITAEVMCHGGSSPGSFAKYLKERFPGEKIRNYFFRSKRLLNWGHSEVVSANGGTIARLKGPSDYFSFFNSCLSTRKSCGTCQAASLPRQADFTMADAWGISKYNPRAAGRNGTSLISVNSDRASRILQELSDQIEKIERVPLEWVLTHGQPMARPFKPTSFLNDRFFALLKNNSFHRARDYTSQGKFDVAVAGVWFGGNYGSILTYYSLYSYLKSLGLLVLMIEKPSLSKNDLELDWDFHSRKFARKHYGHDISRMRSTDQMWELNRFADTFILGCDQVFNYGIYSGFKNTFLFNYVEDLKKKIAYASSFGHSVDFAPPEKRPEIARLFNRFDHISVREESGARLLRKHYGFYNAEPVMDSIFLNDADFYKNLAEESGRKAKGKFIAAYILDPTPEIEAILKHMEEKTGCKIILLLDGFKNKFAENQAKINIQAEKDIEACDWLYYLSNAEYIVTDSYHGVCFSILLNKNFTALPNRRRGLARFQMIFDATGLKSRMMHDISNERAMELVNDKIDYEAINKILADKIEKSKAWLKNALFSPKKIRNPAKWRLETEELYDQPLPDNMYVKITGQGFHLQFCKNLEEYLDALNKSKKDYIIAISVRDTPGAKLSGDVARKLLALGVIHDLQNKHWHSFYAVLNSGVNTAENLQKERWISWSGEIDGKKIIIDSAPFKQGDVANIIIDDYNYSLNKRGLNIVVLEKKSGKVIDTVNFDTYESGAPCSRVN